jgi:hypothetical protein
MVGARFGSAPQPARSTASAGASRIAISAGRNCIRLQRAAKGAAEALALAQPVDSLAAVASDELLALPDMLASPEDNRSMYYAVLANFILVVHLVFIMFVLAGGFLVLWNKRWLLLHLPALVWGAWSEFTAAICPLTPLEQGLLARAGKTGYSGGFIDHYLIPIIYPAALTPQIQVVLGIIVLAANAIVYIIVWRRWRNAKQVSLRQPEFRWKQGK